MTIAVVLFACAGLVGMPALAQTAAQPPASTPEQNNDPPELRAARERVTRIEQAEGGESVSLATALLELGVLLDSQNADAQSRVVLERALAIREKRLGKEHTATAVVLTRLGLVFEQEGNLAEARSALERSLAIREKLLGKEHADTIASLSDLGRVLHEMGELDAALALLERALTTGEKVFGPRDPRVAGELTDLGRVHAAQGRADDARRMTERALAIRSQVLGPEDLATAESQHDLAVLSHSAGEYVRACELYQSAMSTRSKRLGPGHPDTARSEIGLGSVLLAQGRFTEAEARLRNALAVCESQLGGQHPTTLRALDALSALLVELGRYREARPLLQRVYAGQQKLYSRDHPVLVATLGRLALLLAKLGDADAESLLERAIEMSEATHSDDPSRTARLVRDLAELFQAQERYVEAEPLYERVLAISEKRIGAEHPDTARALERLAACLRVQAKTSRARPLYERALAILEQTVGPEHPDTSGVLHSLGALARDEGDFASARTFLERALAARTLAFGAEHPLAQRTRQLLIFVLADSGDRDAAWELASKGLRANDGEWMRSLWRFSASERLQSIAGRRATLELLLDFLPAESEPAERLAYESIVESKGPIARRALEDPDRVVAAFGPAAVAELGELRGVQAEIGAEESRAVVADRDARERRLAELRERRSALERALQVRWTSSLGAEDIDTASIARSLPEGTALADFFVHQGYVPALRSGTRVTTPGRLAEPRLSVWISKAGANLPARIDLGPAHAARQSTRAFLESLQTQRVLAAATSVGRTAFEEASGRLIELLWLPMKPAIGDAPQVFISPDRFLGTLPFEALLQDDGTYLIEERRFVYLLDATIPLAIARRSLGASAGAEDALLAVGSVDYNMRGAPPIVDEEDLDDDVASPISFLEPWQKLRFSGREATVVAETFASTHTEGAKATQLREGLATEVAMKRDMPGRRYLHLATHGFFQHEASPSVHASDHGEPASFEATKRASDLAPGRLSGLACAGANLPPDGVDDDGLLTADEITSLDLAACDLAVLTACSPELGTERGGEGLMTLQRALQMSGAKTVITSLWSVDDTVTVELLRSFYRRLWTEKQPKVDALRGAQLELLKKNRAAHHGAGLPYTWAGLVSSGDWR